MTEEYVRWRKELRASLNDASGPLSRVVFLRATDSTQEAARRMRARPGDVVIAGRQTAGKGRLGRKWADTRDDGVAATLVLPPESGGRLAIAGAIAAAHAAEAVLERGVGIKWPNDVIVNGRKLAGVLVEQVNGVALVGIGINVRQTDWAAEPNLAGLAVSLRQLGAKCSCLEVAKALLRAANAALGLDEKQLASEYAVRDVLVGQEATFCVPGAEIVGTVLQLDPLRGLLVRDAKGDRWLDAATTSLGSR